ncbi:hypothetical protein X798_02171 [Onchocerca flexuosa]|uniref:G_PROTEIN_RECEP_F1_2 domain-containing protein n=2 Tax=Onchocerca flexuosa TaxID=387005 RepID=A0A183H4W8_9BILA|nr:hypothetical protein X798_02171 [Onchocerca flexuosa]VDO33303.1 unnamed protein product [Onchocerca flexuosa]
MFSHSSLHFYIFNHYAPVLLVILALFSLDSNMSWSMVTASRSLQKNSLVAIRNSKAVTLWSLILVIAPATFSMILFATVITIYVKRCKSKPRRVGSDAGTDF